MTFEQMNRKLAEMQVSIAYLAKHGVRILPDDPEPIEVVWSGGPLLPDRESVEDDRFRFVPSYDIDDGGSSEAPARRKYTFTGNHTRIKRIAIDPVESK